MAELALDHYLVRLDRIGIRRKPLRIGGHYLFDQSRRRWTVNYNAALNDISLTEYANKDTVVVHDRKGPDVRRGHDNAGGPHCIIGGRIMHTLIGDHVTQC